MYEVVSLCLILTSAEGILLLIESQHAKLKTLTYFSSFKKLLGYGGQLIDVHDFW